jgi:hypothetical protein
MTIYHASNGRYYTDWEVGVHFEEDRWRACMWSESDGWELVETAEAELLYLEPVPPGQLPSDVEIVTNGGGFEEIDDRRVAFENRIVDGERPRRTFVE